MTVKELKDVLEGLDDNLIVIIETVEQTKKGLVERNELAGSVEFNDLECYIVSEEV